MADSAWYLRCRRDDVGDRAILVGDRGRVAVAAELLDAPAWLNEDRGLTTITGGYRGQRVTVSAFGMGAPIAAVVLHELASIGVTTVLRLGTVMGLPPTRLGDLVVADAAIRYESTSGTYVPPGFPAATDFALGAALRRSLECVGRRWVSGVVASYDGFYSEMFPLDGERLADIDANLERLERYGVVGIDMETSAVLAIGRALGVQTGSLCLATVDARARHRLADDARAPAERDLLRAGLDALAAPDDTQENR